jgi:uncharacterized protein
VSNLRSDGVLRDEDEGDGPESPEAPETPPDEPPPVPVQDPPPAPQSPYVVRAGGTGNDVPGPTRARQQTRRGEAVFSQQKERRGFASMSPDKQREIASKGGRAAHQKGTAHEWTSEEARAAGRKGGQISRGGRGRLMTAPADIAPEQSHVSSPATGSSVFDEQQ